MSDAPDIWLRSSGGMMVQAKEDVVETDLPGQLWVRLADYHDLLAALHDAIDRPKGVVPASADRFYDPQRFYPAPPAAMKDGG